MKNIKKLIQIKTNLKSFNILRGIYKSIYKNESLEFKNLKEYTYNDDVRMIDWKSSTRNKKLLVKEFESKNNHNIILIIDSNNRMNADTNNHENKKELSINIAEILSLVAKDNNDIINKIFENNLNNSLKNIIKIKKRNIIFIITDIKGINKLEEKTLSIIIKRNDLFIININDNYHKGKNIYNIESKKFIPAFFFNDKKLYSIEKEIRDEIINEKIKAFRKYKINIITISSEEEIIKKLIQLMEEHIKWTK